MALLRQNTSAETTSTIESKYFTTALSLTGSTDSKIKRLVQFYFERMNTDVKEEKLTEIITEYVTHFQSRGMDAFEIIANKIAANGRKDIQKRNISYFIGCLRHVLENGIGATGGYIEERTISMFQDKFNIELTPNGRTKLLQIAGKHGTAHVLIAIIDGELEMEEILLEAFEKQIKKLGKECS